MPRSRLAHAVRRSFPLRDRPRPAGRAADHGADPRSVRLRTAGRALPLSLPARRPAHRAVRRRARAARRTARYGLSARRRDRQGSGRAESRARPVETDELVRRDALRGRNVLETASGDAARVVAGIGAGPVAHRDDRRYDARPADGGQRRRGRRRRRVWRAHGRCAGGAHAALRRAGRRCAGRMAAGARMSAAPDAVRVCASDALTDGGAGVRVDATLRGEQAVVFFVRYDGRAYGYLNRCAHVPMELDWPKGNSSSRRASI
ncbi:Uncharacterised protein [Clostridium sporogenes]|nr:Uncharacterised protein [Clostridium sporogenes]